jgi:hypothetical protein
MEVIQGLSSAHEPHCSKRIFNIKKGEKRVRKDV